MEKTEKLLGEYQKRHPGLHFTVWHFESADSLLACLEKNNGVPDLVFMDIYMPDDREGAAPAGLKAAEQLRSMGYRGKLVFLTSSKEHALEAYGVDAAQYMVKPISEDRFFGMLTALLREIREGRKKYVVLRLDEKLVRVPFHQIVFCEAQRKMQCLHLADGTQHSMRLTMKELGEMLTQYPEFAKIGISYVVNLEHISSLDIRKVEMDTGETVYLPRGAFKDLKKQYFSFYCPI